MKILTAVQIGAWDQATLALQGIRSLALMERASLACTDWIISRYPPETPFVIVCGTGNNGGDGLAITRQLIAKGYGAMAFVAKHTTGFSPDCMSNLEALEAIAGPPVQVLKEGEFITDLPEPVVIVDAIFGIGINRIVEGYAAEFIRHLNSLPNEKISIDLPSGMPSDERAPEGAVIVQAQHTLTFQQYKRAMLHPESGAFCGEIHLLPIGLDPAFAGRAEGHWHTIDRAQVKDLYRPRQPFTHKGSFGTALMIGGSYGMIGAILLATRAAGRAGAGMVRALMPECGYTILQTAVPEAMCHTNGQHFLQKIGGWESAKGIGIGPGLGAESDTATALGAFLKAVQQPIVMDADALNLLAKHPEWFKLIPRHTILTPHPKELERLFGPCADTYARADLVREKAMEHQLIIVAKDRYTLIALPDGRCYYNTAGNAGLATGGSGDVLCGMLTGLLAQGYSPEDAALLGVYLHAVAGDEAVLKTGMEALVASDVVDHIGAAFLKLSN